MPRRRYFTGFMPTTTKTFAQDHPSISQHLKKGRFSIWRTAKNFSKVFPDQTINQSISKDKTVKVIWKNTCRIEVIWRIITLCSIYKFFSNCLTEYHRDINKSWFSRFMICSIERGSGSLWNHRSTLQMNKKNTKTVLWLTNYFKNQPRLNVHSTFSISLLHVAMLFIYDTFLVLFFRWNLWIFFIWGYYSALGAD